MNNPFRNAKWISSPGCPADTAPVFRRVFNWNGGPAMLYITGVGFYDLRINGQAVTDELLNPAFTRYDKTVYYQTISLPNQLTQGENTIEVTLGNGWYNAQEKDGWLFHQAVWKQRPLMICALYAGENAVLVSDASWQWAESATVFNSLRCGETCDARITPDFCHSVAVTPAPGGELKPQTINPICVRRVINPVSANDLGDAVVYDFRATAGNAEITVSGPAGAKVTLHYAERLTEDGHADQAESKQYVYTERFQQDEYILKGEGEETWHSLFGYNGFRYVQVTADAGVKLIRVAARQFHTDLPQAGGFTAADESISRIQAAVVQSVLTNFHHIPTDCPHREKNGWTGDACLSCRQALYNLDMRDAYTKWLDDIVDCQRPSGQIPCIAPTSAWGYSWGSGITWDAVLTVIPWEMYRAYGDESILRRYAGAIKAYLTFMETMMSDGVPAAGLGDWCPPKEAETMPEKALRICMAILVGQISEKMGRILGDEAFMQQGRAIVETCTAAFHRDYDGLAGKTHAQLYYAMRLYLGLTDDPAQDEAWLVESMAYANGRILGGIFTARYVPEALMQIGRFDLLWKGMTAKGYPGWDYMEQLCGGTLGEKFDGDASRNHHMYSCIGAWYYEAVAGIIPAEPGYGKILIAPHIPEDLPAFSAWHDTPHGRIAVDYAEGKLTVTVPEHIPATLRWMGRETTLNGGTQVFTV